MADDAKTLFGTYALSKLNGKGVTKGEWDVPSLTLVEDGDKVRVHVNVSNIMNGVLSYENGRLTGMLMTTMMMGPPFHMDVERALGVGFEKGMRASREGDRLTLSHGEDTLVFVVDGSTAA
ncbi:hypothetical protein TraAM80_04890 [Trypanosoma rangeli]|uniref:DUF306 domain-containing protein n=1 Tax=Trypanosoma rangeli TaxID=5698 RepID=A0A3R7MLL8_TRYRA|nr:uncharacterized protein TraAM80_04890 [Trypanosoma rangeli]RNF04748.1 hypothetical protein TraAM80_04890 [Trypanosoma rangeli]|eukprot:RNF04748.1 hypothetical protein TraAM80_04890 [Trypanosoma rangeli]